MSPASFPIYAVDHCARERDEDDVDKEGDAESLQEAFGGGLELFGVRCWWGSGSLKKGCSRCSSLCFDIYALVLMGATPWVRWGREEVVFVCFLRNGRKGTCARLGW